MSQTGPFIRVNTVSAPLKGSFPLDHEGTCKLEMLNYMVCLHEKKQQNSECRQSAKDYFECRMNHGLMDKEEWNRLGYGEANATKNQISQ
uniref:CHCH domain-containing protein n=1 Tax=Caenorhabditis japonica TaxID=281687 RepID=A0A8R1DE80_CAEJA